jgi:hypothetical protein
MRAAPLIVLIVLIAAAAAGAWLEGPCKPDASDPDYLTCYRP